VLDGVLETAARTGLTGLNGGEIDEGRVDVAVGGAIDVVDSERMALRIAQGRVTDPLGWTKPLWGLEVCSLLGIDSRGSRTPGYRRNAVGVRLGHRPMKQVVPDRTERDTFFGLRAACWRLLPVDEPDLPYGQPTAKTNVAGLLLRLSGDIAPVSMELGSCNSLPLTEVLAQEIEALGHRGHDILLALELQ